MKRINANTPNSVLLNVVRNNASYDYRNRIPVATQGNTLEILSKLESYRPDWNEFIEILLNVPALELYRAREIDNPLARFKRGAIRPGTWVKEIGVGLVKAHSYDKDATNVFGRRDADVRQSFHYQNRQDKYAISISEEQLAQAFYEETGLASFVNMLMMSLQNSDNLDEYLIMRDLIAQFDEQNPIYNVQVPDFIHGKNLDGTNMTQDEIEQAGKLVARQIKSYGSKFRFANRAADYNPEGLPTISRNTILLCSSDFLAAFDVEVLAAAFNIDRVELWGRIVEVDDIGIEGCQAILADEDWFVCVDTLLETRSAENPDGLFRNYFLHHWGIYSISKFLPAVMFSTRESTDVTHSNPTPASISFTNTPSSLVKGAGNRLAYTVADTNGGNITDTEGVAFEFVPTASSYLSNGQSNWPTSTNTFVEAGPDGFAYVWIGSDETAPYLSVKGTAVDAGTVTATVTVAVEGNGDTPEPPTPSDPVTYVSALSNGAVVGEIYSPSTGDNLTLAEGATSFDELDYTLGNGWTMTDATFTIDDNNYQVTGTQAGNSLTINLSSYVELIESVSQSSITLLLSDAVSGTSTEWVTNIIKPTAPSQNVTVTIGSVDSRFFRVSESIIEDFGTISDIPSSVVFDFSGDNVPSALTGTYTVNDGTPESLTLTESPTGTWTADITSLFTYDDQGSFDMTATYLDGDVTFTVAFNIGSEPVPTVTLDFTNSNVSVGTIECDIDDSASASVTAFDLITLTFSDAPDATPTATIGADSLTVSGSGPYTIDPTAVITDPGVYTLSIGTTYDDVANSATITITVTAG